jgi:STE24 endopeptidase
VAMTIIQTRRVGGGHYGAWRAVAALPTMIASMLLLLVLLGWMREWDSLVLLAWLGCGLLTLTRRGERVAVHLACGFRRLSPDDSAAVSNVWSDVLARCDMSSDDVDLYVQRGESLNAYAVGGRSVAVTSRIVRDYRSGRIDDQLLGPILCHELGHHATYGGRFTPITLWLALPWRLFCGAVLRIASGLAGRQPQAPLFAVVVAVVVVAIVQASQHHAWDVVAVLGSLAVFSVACPLADAAVGRAGERAADRYTAQAGFGDDLARALASISPDSTHRRGLPHAILSRHPRTSQRIRDLDGWSPPCTPPASSPPAIAA